MTSRFMTTWIFIMTMTFLTLPAALNSPPPVSADDPPPVSAPPGPSGMSPPEATGQYPDEAAARLDEVKLKDIDILDVLQILSEKTGRNIIAGKGVSGRVTMFLKDVSLPEALRIILDANGLAYVEEGAVIRVMTAAEFEQRFGHPFGAERETRLFRLTHVSAADAQTLFTNLKSPSGRVIADTGSSSVIVTDTPEQIALMAALAEDIDQPLETQVFTLRYAAAEGLSGKITEVLTPDLGRMQFDEASNRLIITDTREKLSRIARLIVAFDVRRPEVLIEAKIMQVILNNEHKYGVDWEHLLSEYHDLDFKSNFDILGESDKGGRVRIGTIDDDQYTVLVHALETAGITNILSAPSVTAVHKEEARILIGSTEPYVTTTTTTPASGPSTISESVNFIEVGVKLYVTPTIHGDGFVTMRLRPEVSSVTRSLVTGNNNIIPVVETSEAETTVTVKDNVTLVIGGLMKEERISTKNRVPLLGQIPLVGYAFRNEDEMVRKTEIIIFLTPRVITGDVPASVPGLDDGVAVLRDK